MFHQLVDAEGTGHESCGTEVKNPGWTDFFARVFLDLAEPFHEKNPAGSRLAILSVDGLSRYKLIAFVAITSDTTAVLLVIIARYFAVAGVNFNIRTGKIGGL